MLENFRYQIASFDAVRQCSVARTQSKNITKTLVFHRIKKEIITIGAARILFENTSEFDSRLCRKREKTSC